MKQAYWEIKAIEEKKVIKEKLFRLAHKVRKDFTGKKARKATRVISEQGVVMGTWVLLGRKVRKEKKEPKVRRDRKELKAKEANKVHKA